MAIDMFSTREMLNALEQRVVPRTFLRGTFIRETNVSTAQKIDIDIEKNKRKLAPFVSPMVAGKVISRDGFSTKTVQPAYIKMKRITTAGDVLKRSMGENIYGAKSPQARAQELLGRDMRDLDDMIVRREEWMVATALFTGKLPVVGEGVSYEVDFGYEADKHILTLGTGSKWGDSGVDPLADLLEWKRDLGQRSGLTADVAIMGADAMAVFIASLTEKQLNYMHLSQVKIDPKQLPQGVTYWGRTLDSALDLYTYDEWYYDEDTATEKPMVPVNAVLLASTSARTIMHYGAILDMEALFAVSRFPKSWIEKDPSARMLLLQSAPLFNPVQVDGFTVVTVK